MLYAKCLKVSPAWQRATWLNNSNVIAIKPLSIFHNESASILQYSGILATKRQEKSFNENVLIRKWGLWRCYMLDFIKLKHPYRDGLHKLVWVFKQESKNTTIYWMEKEKEGEIMLWLTNCCTVNLWWFFSLFSACTRQCKRFENVQTRLCKCTCPIFLCMCAHLSVFVNF